MMKRCVFFDRDGIANRAPAAPGYVLRPEDFHVLPAFLDALAIVERAQMAAAIVTNQRCVALGLLTADRLHSIHEKLCATVRKRGLDLLDILYCPHDDGECICRKPRPGMLFMAAERHGLDLSRSWMIGDQETDVETGRAAGCRTVRVHPCPGATRADYTLSSMDALPGFLAQHL